jgi:hypothetical protein
MDEHDNENLEFLMSLDEPALMEFLDQIDPDDLEYAQELLDQYEVGLRARALALGINFDEVLFEDDVTVPEGVTIH